MKKKKFPKIGQKITIDLGFTSEEQEGKTEQVTVVSFEFQAIQVKTILGTIFFINLWQII